MENEPDLYAYNLTLKVIFFVSLILVILDLIQLFDIFDSIIKAYENGEIVKTIFQPLYSAFKYDFVKEEEIKW